MYISLKHVQWRSIIGRARTPHLFGQYIFDNLELPPAASCTISRLPTPKVSEEVYRTALPSWALGRAPRLMRLPLRESTSCCHIFEFSKAGRSHGVQSACLVLGLIDVIHVPCVYIWSLFLKGKMCVRYRRGILYSGICFSAFKTIRINRSGRTTKTCMYVYKKGGNT